MDSLLPLAEKIAARLIERKETVSVAEGSSGGLISAALLAVPGASAYYVGGAVVYTGAARSAFAEISLDEMRAQKIRPASEAYAALLAQRTRERLQSTWALAEAGAAGPSGNRYGDPAGHTCVAVAGPTARAATLRTGNSDRPGNMRAFAARALELLAEQVGAK
ncbi:MAG: CinA family protein [Alphaproteobacteria bacterium]|nr:CinA family protein [Alphaproteobacteria bacterium]